MDLSLAIQNKLILDKDWRMANLYKIVDKDGRRVLLNENPIQKKIRKHPSKRKRILKARQFGVSTGCIIDAFDDCIWNADRTVVILAHEKDAIQKLFRIVARAYKFMPEELKPKVDRGGGSRYEMYFPEINSRIYCDLESRGDTIHRLHISEAAFADHDRLRSTLEAVPLNGIITWETTPNGLGNHFYEDWIDENSTAANLFFPWYMHDEYKISDITIDELTEDELKLKEKALKLYGVKITNEQIAFRRQKKSDLKDLFIQEYPEDDQTCFLSSGNTVMDLALIKELKDKAKKPIEKLDDIEIYEKPNIKGLYVCGADVAEGVGGDYSTACMINARTREEVASVRGHFKPSEFAQVLNKMCKHFLVKKTVHPLLAVERNNHGHAVLLALTEIEKYPHLYHAQDERVGWKTDKITRPIMINGFIDAIENRNFNFNSAELFKECLTFINNDGKLEAADGKHDDTIIAAAIALQMCAEVKVLDVYEDVSQKILI